MPKLATKANPRPRTAPAPIEKPEEQEREKFKPSIKDAARGHLMMFTYWAVVSSTSDSDLNVDDVDRVEGEGFAPFSVRGESLVEPSMSATQYDEEIKINASDLSTKVLECRRVPFTVCFDTKTKHKRVLSGRLRHGDGSRGYANVDELVQNDPNKPRHRQPKAIADRIRQVDLRRAALAHR